MSDPLSLVQAADSLVGLRPYRLPDAVAWWPPAPGWWLLGVVLLGLVAVLFVRVRRRRRCRAAVRAAMAELARLRASAGTPGAADEALRALSRLLRRYALVVYPREQVAGLSGEDWLRFLDRHGGDGRFAAGPGRALADAPYRPPAAVDLAALADLVGDWIRRNPGSCR